MTFEVDVKVFVNTVWAIDDVFWFWFATKIDTIIKIETTNWCVTCVWEWLSNVELNWLFFALNTKVIVELLRLRSVKSFDFVVSFDLCCNLKTTSIIFVTTSILNKESCFFELWFWLTLSTILAFRFFVSLSLVVVVETVFSTIFDTSIDFERTSNFDAFWLSLILFVLEKSFLDFFDKMFFSSDVTIFRFWLSEIAFLFFDVLKVFLNVVAFVCVEIFSFNWDFCMRFWLFSWKISNMSWANTMSKRTICEKKLKVVLTLRRLIFWYKSIKHRKSVSRSKDSHFEC